MFTPDTSDATYTPPHRLVGKSSYGGEEGIRRQARPAAPTEITSNSPAEINLAATPRLRLAWSLWLDEDSDFGLRMRGNGRALLLVFGVPLATGIVSQDGALVVRILSAARSIVALDRLAEAKDEHGFGL
jgi:hypothetical protein